MGKVNRYEMNGIFPLYCCLENLQEFLKVYATLDNDSVTPDMGVPNLTPQRKGRYRVKSN